MLWVFVTYTKLLLYHNVLLPPSLCNFFAIMQPTSLGNLFNLHITLHQLSLIIFHVSFILSSAFILLALLLCRS